MPLTKTDKAYIAGFVDGEGCIGIRNGGSNCRHGRVRLHITNTDKEILIYIKDLIGYGCFYQGKKEGQYYKNAKAVYIYEVAALQCKKFLLEILPYLKVKKKQAILALEFQETLKRCNNISDEMFKKRSEIKKRFKELNKRGIS